MDLESDDVKTLALVLGGLWLLGKISKGADYLEKNVVEPVKKFVGPSTVPPGPLQAALLSELDGLMHDFAQANTDDIRGARAAIANNNATVEQKLTAILSLHKKIEEVESFGQLVPEAARARVASLKTALEAYAQKEVQPEAARVRLR